MKGLAPLLKKELKEQFKTYRWLIVGGIFLLFGITTPLMFKYLPEILEFAGEQLTIIEIPPPTAVQSLSEYASTIGQIGILVAVLVAMGSIANELRHGTAIMTMSKPVSRLAFVSAKFIAMSLTFLGSMVLASIFCFAYTVWLIESADIQAFIGLNLLLGLFLVFCLAITLLFSSFFKSSLAAGGLALAVIVAQAGLAVLPRFGDYMPGKLLGWGNNLLTGNGESYWWALAITIGVICFCIYFAQRTLKHKDL
ncbi:MAG TPA: ABC transporter permease [Dehalococcoidia bacterium]|nr:ABC transporter permease [Dehalococcoidia bacterium]